MFPSGQWSFNPLAYQNIPSDNVDWASLAQQWIKMKETTPILNQEPTPPPAPQISKPKNFRPESIVEPPPNDIEGGEAPMDMDTKDDDIPESVGASSNWNQWNNWPNQWGWGWSGNAGTVPSADNASSTSSSVDSKVKWSENFPSTNTVKSTSEAWSKASRPRQFQKPVVIEQTPDIDAVKKKQLPAWIREGLSKMEREKQKKIERERLMQERLMRKQVPFREDSPEENLPITASNSTYVPDNTSQNAITIPSTVHPLEPPAIVVPDPPCLSFPLRNKEENTSLIRKTKDEIMEESMLKIRRILTEILLEATENHVVMIAKEELKRAKLSARAIRRSNPVSSLSGNLGLNIYGSGSDDSDSSSSENTHFDIKSDSDEELKLLIDRKKEDFRKIEDEIEIEIEKQEAKEKSISRQDEEEEDENDDENKDSEVDDIESNSDLASRPQVSGQDVRYKRPRSKEGDDSVTRLNDSQEYHVPNEEPSGNDNEENRSSSQLNGNRKNGKVESKHARSQSSSSSSDSKSESSSKSSRSKSNYSSRSGSDSDTSNRKKNSKRSEKTKKRSKKPEKPKRYRSRSRSPSRDHRATDSRVYSSRSYKYESYGRRPSPYRRRSRSRQRSSSRGREKYSESRRYDSHSRSRRRRSNSADSRRSRYKRR